jgi:hypothetical protein
MRSKLLIGGLCAAVAFLLATSPVVAQAAAFITSADIMNNTIKGKDVKDSGLKGKDIKDRSLTGADVGDGSLTSSDLAAGTIPDPQVKSFRRFEGGTDTPIVNATLLAFYGPQVTVVVDGNDVVAASGTMDVKGTNAGDEFYYSLCRRPVGSGASPTPIGGNDSVDIDVPLSGGDMTVTRVVSGVPAAGSYDVGMCAHADASNTGTLTFRTATGYAQVLNGTGPLS